MDEKDREEDGRRAGCSRGGSEMERTMDSRAEQTPSPYRRDERMGKRGSAASRTPTTTTTTPTRRMMRSEGVRGWGDRRVSWKMDDELQCSAHTLIEGEESEGEGERRRGQDP